MDPSDWAAPLYTQALFSFGSAKLLASSKKQKRITIAGKLCLMEGQVLELALDDWNWVVEEHSCQTELWLAMKGQMSRGRLRQKERTKNRSNVCKACQFHREMGFPCFWSCFAYRVLLSSLWQFKFHDIHPPRWVKFHSALYENGFSYLALLFPAFPQHLLLLETFELGFYFTFHFII